MYVRCRVFCSAGHGRSWVNPAPPSGMSEREWLANLGVTTLFIEPGSPLENGYVESFIGKLRDELLNGEIFDTLLEASVVMERWRREYNRYRPHSFLGYKSPSPEAFEAINLTLEVVD